MANTALLMEKPFLDENEYNFFKLPNGLRVVLGIGKSTENEPITCLSVRVGDFHDPENAKGLSNLLCNCMVYGSGSNDGLRSVLGGGVGDICCECTQEYTTFYFMSDEKNWEKELDELIKCLNAPTFDKVAVEKAIEKIDSDVRDHIREEDRFIKDMIATIAIPRTPFHKFTSGNLVSLKEEPEKNKVDIPKLLASHHKSYYVGENMCLFVAVSKEKTFAKVKEMITKKFSAISKSKIPDMKFQTFANCLEAPQFNCTFNFTTRNYDEILYICWPIPTIVHDDASVSANILSGLFGDEAEGSIYYVLEKEGLLHSLYTNHSARPNFYNSTILCMFTVTVLLTEKGTKNIDRIYEVVYGYINMLKEAIATAKSEKKEIVQAPTFTNLLELTGKPLPVGSVVSYIDESVRDTIRSFKQATSRLTSQYLPEATEALFVTAPEKMFSKSYLFKKIDPKDLTDILEKLTPNRMMVFHGMPIDSQKSTEVTPTTVTIWRQYPYTTVAFPPEFKKKLENPIKDKNLHLPKVNYFIPESLELLPEDPDMQEPVELLNYMKRESYKRFGQLWYVQNRSLKEAVGGLSVQIWSPGLTKTPNSSILLHLFQKMTDISLKDVLYPITISGIKVLFRFRSNGLQINMWGNSDRLMVCFAYFLNFIIDDHFACKTTDFVNLVKNYKGKFLRKLADPMELLTKVCNHFLRKYDNLPEHRLSKLEDISVADIISFTDAILSNCYLTFFVTGNVSKEHAVQGFDYAIKRLKSAPAKREVLGDLPTFEPNAHYFRFYNSNVEEKGLAIKQVHLLPVHDLKAYIYTQFIFNMIQGPYQTFVTLELKKCDGSMTYVTMNEPEGFHPVGIILNCTIFDEDIDTNKARGKLLAFWLQMAPRCIANISEERLKMLATWIPNPTYKADSDDIQDWIMDTSKTFTVDFTEEVQKIMSSITKQSILEFFINNYLDPKNYCTLSFETIRKEPLDSTRDDYISTIIHQAEMTDKDITQEQKSYTEFKPSKDLLEKLGIDQKATDKALKEVGSKILDKNQNGMAHKEILVKDYLDMRRKLLWKELKCP